MAKKYFVGFSTIDKTRPPYTLTDIDLVKRDILNQFYTVKGERVMMPNFGSDIHRILMDPMDETTMDLIVSDAITIINAEPRVRLIDIQPYTDQQTVMLTVILDFIPQEVRDTLYATFTVQSQETY